MKIDQLPVEILMKIVSYLPKFGAVSQVNKLFYGIACKVNDPNICLRIDRRFFEHFQRQQSIEASNRQIRKVEYVGAMIECIDSVVKTFSATIKVLKLSCVTIDVPIFMEMLSLTPNLEYLQLHEIRFRFEDQSSKERRSNDELNLKQLRSLLTDSSKDEFVEVVNRLPVGVLTEMEIYCSWDRLTALLGRQFNIKNLIWGHPGDDNDDELAVDVFGKLTLEQLKIYRFDDVNSAVLAENLSKLTTLKSLVLAGADTIIDERIMNAIASCLELEALSVDVSETPVSSFVNIRRLKKLRDLKIACCSGVPTGSAVLRALAESDNTSIKSLSLDISARMSVELIGALAKSAPHLTHLCILQYDFLSTIELDPIMQHFNCIESLVIPTWDEPLAYHSSFFNLKLRELEIRCEDWKFRRQDLTTLIAAYPNLKRLKITSSLDLDISLEPILNGFTKLESLAIRTGQLVVEDLNYFFDHKDKLKFVLLGDLMECLLDDEFVKKLSGNFDVVNVDRGRGVLKMAVDRHTMNHESELFWEEPWIL